MKFVVIGRKGCPHCEMAAKTIRELNRTVLNHPRQDLRTSQMHWITQQTQRRLWKSFGTFLNKARTVPVVLYNERKYDRFRLVGGNAEFQQFVRRAKLLKD